MSRPQIPAPPFLVAGLGRAGQAAVRALCAAVGPELVSAWDADTGRAMRRLQQRLEVKGVRAWLGPPPRDTELRCGRSLVKSPGIPFDEPLIQRARAIGLHVLDELELGWRLSRVPMLAVTGTNGKSTVAGLIKAVISAAGYRVELAGNTEFGPPLSAVSESLDCVVCEVSSFQLEGCDHLLPEIGVLTNLTPEHLGRHGTMARYGECKRRLFVRGGFAVPHAVVDADDPFACALAKEMARRGGKVTRVGLAEEADYRLEAVQWDLRRARIAVRTPSGHVGLDTALPGAYNARNIALALATADLVGIEPETSIDAISAYEGPPGRFEHIDAGQPFSVIVDFAHTPDGLEQFLSAVRSGMTPGTQLTVVLGFAARPGTALRELGRLARQFSDHLILTTCGFQGFPPLPCLSEMLRGARTADGGEVEVILDRRRAIGRAVRSVAVGGAVAIPGRGALPAMLNDRRGIAVPFDDREVAREILNELAAPAGWGVAKPISS